ncbi:MAG: methionyl-tRNA formyltransferase, partial [Gammaproteobacteria bacterium]
MAKLRTLFAGTPDFAVPSLDALRARADVELVAVYTQPDRPAGRGRRLRPGPVKQRAVAAGVPVLQPPSFTQPEAIEEFAAHRADLLVVAAYGL